MYIKVVATKKCHFFNPLTHMTRPQKRQARKRRCWKTFCQNHLGIFLLPKDASKLRWLPPGKYGTNRPRGDRTKSTALSSAGKKAMARLQASWCRHFLCGKSIKSCAGMWMCSNRVASATRMATVAIALGPCAKTFRWAKSNLSAEASPC